MEREEASAIKFENGGEKWVGIIWKAIDKVLFWTGNENKRQKMAEIDMRF